MNATRAYHHGNLRQSLIDTALQVIEDKGHHALSLRDLAQGLGVSSAAPYRHFPDRDALLQACACEGVKRLREALLILTSGTEPAETKAREMCRAFLAFTENSPGLFMLIYDSGLIQQASDEDELGALLREIYETVARTLGACIAEQDSLLLQPRVIAMWSTLYGYARLRQGNMLKPYMIGTTSTTQIEAAVIATAIGMPFPESSGAVC